MIGHLVTIRIMGPDETIIVHWYHVPRKGDFIDVIENGTYVSGTVTEVHWGSEHVMVRVK